MSERTRASLALFGFILLCSIGSLSAAWQVRNWGNNLSRVDPFSESNAIREVRNFLDTGITANDGLGNVLRPGLYPHQGFEGYPATRPHSVTPSGVYTHYPPGPEYILYVATKLLGAQPISRLRIVPLTLTWLAAVFFGLSVRRRFGMSAAVLVMLACAALPMFSDADSCLHDEGYAFALLLVEIGVSIGVNRLIFPFALLGFFQGWLSFDYFFLVTLVPGAIEWAMPRLDVGHRARKRLALWRCGVAAAGFAFAHLLHFAEVCAFFGSIPAAVHDLADAAAYRTGEFGPIGRVILTCLVLRHYFIGTYPISTFFWRPDAGIPGNWQVFRFGGLTIGIWWLLLTHLFIAVRLMGKTRRPLDLAKRQIDNDWLVVTLCGVVPCSLWYIVMPEHAFIHEHLLYRHLFFCFFLGLLFCAIALVKAQQPILRGLFGAVLRPTPPILSMPRKNNV